MSKRLLRIAALLTAALCAASAAHSAAAAELTLYARPDFGGRDITLRSSATDLGRAGFSDRASSMIVRSGRWELCTGPAFSGRCSVFERGEYPSLERLSDRVSSAREVDGGRDERDQGRDQGRDSGRDLGRDSGRDRAEWSGEGRGVGRGDGRPGYGRPDERERGDAVEMFSSAKFSGSRVTFNDNVPNLRKVSMNDRADSIIVHRGVWEFCVDADFRGQCVTYSPGRYERLGVMGSILSSARRVR